MERLMTTFEKINDVLVHLFQEIWELEEKAIITEEFKDITNNDMHIIEAIGLDEPKRMSEVAARMNVTTGTLTKAVEALEQKGYVNRCRNDRDKRVVRVSLTDSGVRAYEHHARFHSNMIHDIKESLSDQESEILIGTLGKLVKFFQKKYEPYLKNKK